MPLAGPCQIALQGFFRDRLFRVGVFWRRSGGRSISPSIRLGVFEQLEDFVPNQLVEQVLSDGTIVTQRSIQVTPGVRNPGSGSSGSCARSNGWRIGTCRNPHLLQLTKLCTMLHSTVAAGRQAFCCPAKRSLRKIEPPYQSPMPALGFQSIPHVAVRGPALFARSKTRPRKSQGPRDSLAAGSSLGLAIASQAP